MKILVLKVLMFSKICMLEQTQKYPSFYISKILLHSFKIKSPKTIEDVSPGDSIPKRFIIPGIPCTL